MSRELLLSLILTLFLSSCRNSNNNFETILPSPDTKIHLYFNLNDVVAYKYLFNHIKDVIHIKEITELVLYNNLFKMVETENTVLTDSSLSTLSIDETDTFNLPSTFVSDKQYKIEYLQSITQDYPIMKLVRKNTGKNEYRLIYANNDEPTVGVNSGFETSWRIIYISNKLR